MAVAAATNTKVRTNAGPRNPFGPKIRSNSRSNWNGFHSAGLQTGTGVRNSGSTAPKAIDRTT
jgi:hypothetical protein